MFCGLGDEERSLLTIFLALLPAAFYIMGLSEGRKGYYLFLTGIFFHVLSIVLRGLEIGRIPLTEKHDNISFMALSMALTYLYFCHKKNMERLGTVALPLITIFVFVSVKYAPVNTISPFLKTPWFYLYNFFYFISYGFFGISACIGILYLLKEDDEVELLQYKAAIYGWIILSIALVAGSIWFYITYGTYWLWTAKELWATLTWFFFGLYMHARHIKVFSGRPAAILGILGFLVALFTYFGVGTVIPSPPTQF